jgi:hypothetical protein
MLELMVHPIIYCGEKLFLTKQKKQCFMVEVLWIGLGFHLGFVLLLKNMYPSRTTLKLCE